MKKISTVATKQNRNFPEQKLTIGFDLGDRSSWYCVLDEQGEVVLEQRLGTARADRSAVAVSGEASQREGASGSDGDPGASGTGAGTNGAGQHGARTGQELRRATARVQRAEYESGESGGAESRTATGTGAVAGGNRDVK